MCDTENERESTNVSVVLHKQQKSFNLTKLAIFVALGVFLYTLFPFVGAALMAYGFYQAEVNGIKNASFISLLLCMAMVLAISGADLRSMSLYVAPIFASFSLAWGASHQKISVLTVSAIVVIATVLAIAFDAFYAHQLGSNLIDQVRLMASTMIESMAGQSLDMSFAAEQVTEIIVAIWPFLYVMQTLLVVVGAGFGYWVSLSKIEKTQLIPKICNFDAPLWCVGVLATAIIAVGVAASPIPGADILFSVSATTILSVRFIFLLQGVGVLYHQVISKRLGCFFRFLLIFMAIWLETMFFALSIVGLIDIWLNFRKLSR